MNDFEFFNKLQSDILKINVHLELKGDDNDYCNIRMFNIAKDRYGQDVIAYTSAMQALIKNDTTFPIKREDIKSLKIELC